MARRAGDERGAAMVELMLVLPILLFLVFNVIDAGWAIAQQNAIRGAAREAARVAATQNMSDTEIAAVVCTELTRVDTDAVTIAVGPGSVPASGSTPGTGSVSITSGFTPITNTPWSLLQVVSSIGTDLEFRIDGSNSNPTPAWMSAGPGACP